MEGNKNTSSICVIARDASHVRKDYLQTGFYMEVLKHRWLVDEEAADVVRRIYRLRTEGKAPQTIAKILITDKV